MAERLSDKTLQGYKATLQLAHRRYTAEAKPVIERMQNYLRGKQWPDVAPESQTTGVPRLTANLIFADLKVMLPALALRNPRVFVKPTKATGQTADGKPAILITTPQGPVPVPILEVAKAKEALLNWRWRELRIVRQVRRALTDCLLGPFGVVKTGYTLTTEKVDGDELLEANELIKAESPYAVRWPPTQFRVDPECRYPDLSDAGWIAFGWLARPEDLKRNPRFRNTKSLKGTVELTTEWKNTLSGAVATPRDGPPTLMIPEDDKARVQCWELWDKRRGKRLVLADDHERSLEWVDWPQQYENFPAETLTLLETPDELYGYPDLWHVLSQQDAYNETGAMMWNHVKRFLRKYISPRNAFDEKEKAKLVTAADGIVVEADVSDPRLAVVPLADAPIPADVYQVRIAMRDDQDRISGMSDFLRGTAEKVDTATEAEYIQANVSVRINDSRDAVEDFAERLSRQLMQIDAQTLSVPASIPVVGPDGALALGEYLQVSSLESLQAEADCEVQIGSMQPINGAIRKRSVLEVYNFWRNDPIIDQFKLRRLLLPAYQEEIPDLDQVVLSPEQFQQVAQRMQAGQGMPAGPAGPGMGGPPGGLPPPAGSAPPSLQGALAGVGGNGGTP